MGADRRQRAGRCHRSSQRRPIAGARSAKRRLHGSVARALAGERHCRSCRARNTTIGVIATDAPLTKAQCQRLAGAGHDGLARAIRPVHTMSDGDTLFALATGRRGADFNLLCAMAARRWRAPASTPCRPPGGWTTGGVYLPYGYRSCCAVQSGQMAAWLFNRVSPAPRTLVLLSLRDLLASAPAGGVAIPWACWPPWWLDPQPPRHVTLATGPAGSAMRSSAALRPRRWRARYRRAPR